MNDRAKAAINLHAVLRNMEDLCEQDLPSKDAIASADAAIRFSVPDIDRLVLTFRDGVCRAGRGSDLPCDMNLRFSSAEHLNLMVDGKKNPLPTKGFKHIVFLKKSFTFLAERMAYYLKPDPELLKNDPDFREKSTKLTAYTAFYAIPEIARFDEVGKRVARRIEDGMINIVVRDAFAIQLDARQGTITASKGKSSNARAVMLFDSIDTASGILTGTLDSYACIGKGMLSFRGRISMIDNLNKILGIVPEYLS